LAHFTFHARLNSTFQSKLQESLKEVIAPHSSGYQCHVCRRNRIPQEESVLQEISPCYFEPI
jgi:hypothetical protein